MKKEKDLTPEEWKQGLRLIAERAAGVAKGNKISRWTHEDRVAVVYAVLCSLAIKAGAPIEIKQPLC